ncbi:hypothetical protein ACNKHT_25170 [Shigella flexneri]
MILRQPRRKENNHAKSVITLCFADCGDSGWPMIAGHQGYVLIQTDNYNIETSVTAWRLF